MKRTKKTIIALMVSSCIPLTFANEYQLRYPFEKTTSFAKKTDTSINPNKDTTTNQPVSNNNDWVSIDPVISDWINDGDVYDYDEDPSIKEDCPWYPLPEKIEKGVKFTQYLGCFQDQIQTTSTREQNKNTGEIRTVSTTQTDKRTIDINERRQAIGTKINFIEFPFSPSSGIAGTTEVAGGYAMDTYSVGSPIGYDGTVLLYAHFLHNTSNNTYMVQIVGTYGKAPSNNSYENLPATYYNSIDSINFEDSNGNVSTSYLNMNKTMGYKGNYVYINSTIPKSTFDLIYANPGVYPKIRIHKK